MKRSNTQIKFKRRWQVVRHLWSTPTNRRARRNAARVENFVTAHEYVSATGDLTAYCIRWLQS